MLWGVLTGHELGERTAEQVVATMVGVTSDETSVSMDGVYLECIWLSTPRTPP